MIPLTSATMGTLYQEHHLPIIDELCARLPSTGDASLSAVRVLVPGAGLGRLAFEIAKLGNACQDNEFALFMLFASNFCPEPVPRHTPVPAAPVVYDPRRPPDAGRPDGRRHLPRHGPLAAGRRRALLNGRRRLPRGVHGAGAVTLRGHLLLHRLRKQRGPSPVR